jgi:hypothetical protein
MNRGSLRWWATTGAALAVLVGLVSGQLAGVQGETAPTCIMVGAGAAGGFVGLWIAASNLIHTVLQNNKND